MTTPAASSPSIQTQARVTVAGAIDYETATSQTIEVTATSEDGSTSTQSYSIDVTNINEGPVAQSVDLGATNEDTGILITEAQLLANSSDVDAGTTLSITALTLQDNAHGSLTDNGNGTWTFNPTGDLSVNDVTFNFTVSDGTLTDNSTATLDVTAVADAPSLSVSAPHNGNGVHTIISNNSTPFSGSGFTRTIDGWQTDSDALEQHTAYTASEGDWYFELNTDAIGHFPDAANMYQEIATHDGAEYTLTFDFSARPGIDASTSRIEVLWDGVVIDTISADGTSLRDTDWSTFTYSFTGDGDVTRLELREAGVDMNYGRGGFLDNISLVETTTEFTATGLEDTAIDLPNITSSLGDVDNSETLTLSIADIPEGAVLSDGTNIFTADSGSTTADISNWDLDAMTFTAPPDFDGEINLTVNATSTETSNNDTATTSETLKINVLNDHSEDTPTSIYGTSGNDRLNGTSDDDIFFGRGGNDTISGGDGNDLFIFQEGDGNDTINGGAGASWTDTIQLQDEFGGSDLGVYGTDWTVTLTEGTIEETNDNNLLFSDDADGTITLEDGSSIDFTDIERIDW